MLWKRVICTACRLHRYCCLAVLVSCGLFLFGPQVGAFGSGLKAQEAEVKSDQQVEQGSGSPQHDADSAHADSHGDHSAAHGDHGNEYDPTHVNMSDAAEDPAEWRSEKAIATLIVFGCLLAGLTAFAWKPIREGLEKRERSIANNIANAESASQQAMEKLREYEAKLSSAAVEAQQIIASARKDAEAAGQRLIQSAQEEAARQRERAVADIESAKAVALNELAGRSTDLAMSLASRIVGREINAGDHQNMIQDMLSKLPSRN